LNRQGVKFPAAARFQNDAQGGGGGKKGKGRGRTLRKGELEKKRKPRKEGGGRFEHRTNFGLHDTEAMMGRPAEKGKIGIRKKEIKIKG